MEDIAGDRRCQSVDTTCARAGLRLEACVADRNRSLVEDSLGQRRRGRLLQQNCLVARP